MVFPLVALPRGGALPAAPLLRFASRGTCRVATLPASKFNAEWDFLCMLRDEGRRAAEASLTTPPTGAAIIPLLVVVGVNLLMSLLILPRLDFSFLAQERWGGTSLTPSVIRS